jgi:hypothetical protein
MHVCICLYVCTTYRHVDISVRRIVSSQANLDIHIVYPSLWFELGGNRFTVPSAIVCNVTCAKVAYAYLLCSVLIDSPHCCKPPSLTVASNSSLSLIPNKGIIRYQLPMLPWGDVVPELFSSMVFLGAFSTSRSAQA